MKKIIPVALGVSLILGTTMPMASAKNFSDVGQSHWAYTYIDELSNEEVVNGYEDGTYRPSQTITRAEYLKLLVSTVASSKENDKMKAEMLNYTNWFEPYLKFAISEGILEGYTAEEMTQPVSRAEMAKMLVCFADYVGLKTPTPNMLDPNLEYTFKEEEEEKSYSEEEIIAMNGIEGDNVVIADNLDDVLDELELKDYDYSLSGVGEKAEFSQGEGDAAVYSLYTDLDTLDEEDRDAVILASQYGLINGYEDRTFRPKNIMTRAEVATIVYRLGNSFQKVELSVVE